MFIDKEDESTHSYLRVQGQPFAAKDVIRTIYLKESNLVIRSRRCRDVFAPAVGALAYSSSEQYSPSDICPIRSALPVNNTLVKKPVPTVRSNCKSGKVLTVFVYVCTTSEATQIDGVLILWSERHQKLIFFKRLPLILRREVLRKP